MNTPKNITELRLELSESFASLKKDPKRLLQTKELSNAVGKIMSTLKVELEYAKMRKETPKIDFIDSK